VEGVVVFAPAAGTAATAAHSRAAATARRHGWPVILLCDGLPLPGRHLEPGVDALPVVGLSTAALLRGLRHARARNEAAPATPPGAAAVTGLAVDAALSTAALRLAEAATTAGELRRHALGDPRAARHAEAIAWGLRETGAAIAAALAVDLDPDLPVSTHTLLTVTEPLLKAALGAGTRIACDDARAPLRLVPGTVVDLMVHVAADLLPLTPAEGGRPTLRVVVSGSAGELVVELTVVDATSALTTPTPATLATAARCQASLAVASSAVTLHVPLLATEEPGASGPQVLLVDDHAEVAAAIGATLGDADIATITASTAEQALDMLARQPGIRVVVSDLALPGMDGLALARRLRSMDCTARLVLITGFADDRSDAAVREGLFVAAIDKPFSPAVLVAAVRAALR
jgi:CheY-like chemotaxis protein